jgi:hypothetical protein
MAADENVHTLNISRRGLLRGAALVAGGGAALAVGASASATQMKVGQSAAHYQTTPKGNARCNNCSQWLPPTDCKVVLSPVSPTGWCSLYVPKW